MNLRTILILFLCLGSLCGGTLAAQSGGEGTIPTGATLSSKYRLKPTDVIRLKVFQEDDLNTQVRIEADGSIVLPLIGKIYVGGLTTSEAQQMIEDLYEADYLVNPQVTLQVLEYKPRRVQVLGEVNKPGFVIIPPEEELTLTQAISGANGFTRRADEDEVQLRREDRNGETRVNIFDVKAILNTPSIPDPKVRDGDIIFVDESPI